MNNTVYLVLFFFVPMSVSAGSADGQDRVAIAANVHPLARPEFDRGAVPSSFRLERMRMVLKRSSSQQAALDRLLADVQTPGSPSYHRWLKPAEFGRKFGPADADLSALTSWLESQGFSGVRVSVGRTAIEFSGTAGQLDAALGASIHKYRVNGEDFIANATPPSVPATLAGLVRGFAGLNNFARRAPVRRPLDVTPTEHTLTPGDLATIYDVKPLYANGWNGAGVTIGIVSSLPMDVDDVIAFRSMFGLPPNPPKVIANGPAPTASADESTLDASWSGAMAPQATVNVIVTADTATASGVDLSEEYLVNANTADIIAESYFSCEPDVEKAGDMAALDALREQAAAQGITWIGITGDSGAYNCVNFHDTTVLPSPTPVPTVNGRASSPYVVAVGGTQFDDTANPSQYWDATNGAFGGTAKSYIPEIPWNQSCVASTCGSSANIEASGGGASQYYPKPSWQAGVIGIPQDGARDMPDLSLAASAAHDSYYLCYQGKCNSGHGGTSVSAPAFAGIMALLVESQGERQGAVNPSLYRIAASQNYALCDGSNEAALPAASCIFHDITRGTTAIAGAQDQSHYPATAGFDQATGLGSIDAANLVAQWGALRIPTRLTLSLTPQFLAQTGSVALTATLKGSDSGPAPTGAITFFDGPTPVGSAVPVTAQTAILPSATAAATASSLQAGPNAFSAAYSGDSNYMASVAPIQTVYASSPSLACSVMDFVALPNPAPVSGGFGTTTLFTDASCKYDIRVGSPSGPLFSSASGFSVAGTGAWVTSNMTFYLQQQGVTAASGTLATTTVTLAQ